MFVLITIKVPTLLSHAANRSLCVADLVKGAPAARCIITALEDQSVSGQRAVSCVLDVNITVMGWTPHTQ